MSQLHVRVTPSGAAAAFARAVADIWFDGAADNDPPGECPIPATDDLIGSEAYEETLDGACLVQYLEFPESTLHVSSEEYLVSPGRTGVGQGTRGISTVRSLRARTDLMSRSSEPTSHPDHTTESMTSPWTTESGATTARCPATVRLANR